MYRLGDDAQPLDRCPNALLSDPWVQHAIRLYGAYKRGITPNGIFRDETAHYMAVMSMLTSLEEQASAWYMRKARGNTKTRGKHVVQPRDQGQA